MRRILGLLIFLSIVFNLIGCSIANPILYKENTKEIKEEEISYSVEQVLLSKGFQSVEPKVEILRKGLTTSLIASLGLFQSSGIQVSKIIKVGNEMNIYLQNQSNDELSELVVPQVIIELKGYKLRKLEGMQFNIINENYEPYKLKFGLNEAINKIDSEYKIVSNTAPTTNLSAQDGKILWEVTYNSVFDKDNPEAPLANLSVSMDANSGDIINTRKSFISSLIDEGYVLDYVSNKYILYTKAERDMEKNIIKENLWYFDIETHEKSLVYSSNAKINRAMFSPDLEHISLIESSEGNNSLYVIPRQDKKAYKVLFEETLIPQIITWQDSNRLYIVDNSTNNISNIYDYNIQENRTSLRASIEKNITSLRIEKESFMITEEDKENLNFKISITKNWKTFKLIGQGCSPRFIDETTIAFLENSEKENKKELNIYDLEKKMKYDSLEFNISNYYVQANGNIVILENNPNNNDFTVILYDIKDKSTRLITKTNSDKVFYNEEKNLLYVYLQIPFESDKTELIYSIDLSKIANVEP